jgi:hypothetical protein
MRNTGFSWFLSRRSKNSMKRSVVNRPLRVMNRIEPLAETAETMFMLNLEPVVLMTGVCPLTAQVVPL